MKFKVHNLPEYDAIQIIASAGDFNENDSVNIVCEVGCEVDLADMLEIALNALSMQFDKKLKE